jgi:hypothetical protein
MTKPRSVAATANDNSIPGSRLEDGSVPIVKLDPSDPIPSEQVSYQSPIANSVERTAEAQFSDYVSVLDFIPVNLHAGIKNNTNTTDLSTYISNAINSADRRHVFFPQGTYLITDSLNLTIRSWSMVGERTERGQNTQAYRGGQYAAVRINFNPVDKDKFLVNKFLATPTSINIIGPFEQKNLTFLLNGANGFQFGNESLPIADAPGGQAYVHGVRFENCNFQSSSSSFASAADGTMTPNFKRHIGVCKSFESMIYSCSFSGGGYAVRAFGCDKLNVTSCRAYTWFPLDFQGAGTFTAQHTVHDFQTEGWAISPLRNAGVCLGVSNSRFEANVGSPFGASSFLLPDCAATVTAGSGTVTFSRSMTNILIPGWSLIRLSDGAGNTDVCHVTSLSANGLSATVSTSGFRFSWSGSASVTRIHGFGPFHAAGGFESAYTNISGGAYTNTPAFVYVCSRGSMYLTNVFAEFGSYGNIQVLAVGNRPSSQFSMNGQMSMVNCSQLLCPSVPHPMIRVQNWSMQNGEIGGANERRAGQDAFDSLGLIYRRWIYTPARYQTSFNNNQTLVWKYVEGDTGTNQRVWAWFLDGSTGGPSRQLWIFDESLPTSTYGNINILVRAKSVSGTPTINTLALGANAGSSVGTLNLTTSWQTFKLNIARPSLWNAGNSLRGLLLSASADCYVSIVVVEDIAI